MMCSSQVMTVCSTIWAAIEQLWMAGGSVADPVQRGNTAGVAIVAIGSAVAQRPPCASLQVAPFWLLVGTSIAVLIASTQLASCIKRAALGGKVPPTAGSSSQGNHSPNGGGTSSGSGGNGAMASGSQMALVFTASDFKLDEMD